MIKICLIGYGYWGPNLARNFINSGKFQLKSICDKNNQKLKLAKKHYPSSKFFTNFKSAFNNDKYDLAIISTPTSTHYKIAKFILNKKINLLIEKPICQNLRNLSELYKLAKKNKVNIYADYPFLYSGSINFIKKIYDSRKLGKLKSVESYREQAPVRNDTNVIWDLSIHDISILNYLLKNSKIKKISAFKNNIRNQLLSKILFNIEYKNGVNAIIKNSWYSPTKIRMMKFIFDRGTVYCDENESIYKLKIYRQINKNFKKYKLEIPTVDLTEPLLNLAKFIHKSLLNKNNLLINKEFNLNLTKILTKINSI